MICLVFSLLFIELSFRMYLAHIYHTFFPTYPSIIYRLYPELKKTDVPEEPEAVNILLLGASVLNKDYGDIEVRLNRKLQAALTEKVNIFNMATSAQTSLDSLTKYEMISRSDIDIVVVYQSINELRTNNCPREDFDDNYCHYSWYEYLEVAKRHRRSLPYTVIPYSFDYIYHGLRQMFFRSKYIPLHAPLPATFKYGSDIKSARPYYRNLMHIIQLALKRHSRILLMTFAYYVPDNYSLSRFMNKQLDYGEHTCAIEVWGAARNILKGLRVHNAIVRDIARKFQQVSFLDMEQTIPKEKRYFNDICHFTDEGCELFSSILAEKLVAMK